MKEEKGITLIALIITIIVMLILVAVSVTAAVQSGLFTAAGEAVNGTRQAQEEEDSVSSGNVNVEGIGKGNINDIVNNVVDGDPMPATP